MNRRSVLALAAGLGLAAYLAAIAAAQKQTSPIDTGFKNPDGSPAQGKTFTLMLSSMGKTPAVTTPSDPNGHTSIDTSKIPTKGVVVDVYEYPNGNTVAITHGDQQAADSATGTGGVLVASNVPLSSGTTAISFEEHEKFDNQVHKFTRVTTNNNQFVYNSLGPQSQPVIYGPAANQQVRPTDDTGRTYVVTLTNWGGTGPQAGLVTTVYNVDPADVGLPIDELLKKYPYGSIHPDEPKGSSVVNDPQTPSVQDGGSGPAPAPTPTTPKTTPGKSSGWLDDGIRGFANRPFYQSASLVTTLHATTLLLRMGVFESLVAQEQEQGQRQEITYSIIATGKSTGQAFLLVVNDPSGQTQTMAVAAGTTLEPTGQRLTQPLPPDAPGNKQNLNAYCLQFHKDPPPPNMLYRFASAEKQKANEPVRDTLGAVDTLQRLGILHPDIETVEYLDAIRQYAIWTEREKWDQKQFTENWIERTKKNAQYFNVRWTKEMEKTLRAAAPERWSDISQVLELVARTEHAQQLALASTRGK